MQSEFFNKNSVKLYFSPINVSVNQFYDIIINFFLSNSVKLRKNYQKRQFYGISFGQKFCNFHTVFDDPLTLFHREKRLENGTSQENIRLNFQLKKTPLRMTLLSTKSHKFRLSVTFFSSQRKQQKRKKTFLFTARENSKTATVFLQKLREINFFSKDFFVKPCETSNFDEISRKIGIK